ncbi:hypothetical protein [Corynebacterium heidelbergense]|uniref:Uncharacterized protein n=1 Tax=Corynebacterium heidelbergense TaxID=2055947 RepID=A0A364VAQ2_9CORY|nr:hypothetical protein [Corynebacterium heidelbergense]RAV33753.1 hypothetical protein CWC39_06845 [Corynebacterium heidelbergense]WCZ35707.1 hypothetical protein CHEID_00640 [Corynebacterium heidelbergense]
MDQWGTHNEQGWGDPAKKNNRLVLPIAIAGVAILVAVIGGVVWFTRSEDTPQADPQFQATSQTPQTSASGSALPSPSANTQNPQGGGAPCTLEAVHQNAALSSLNVITVCEGNFMHAGKRGSDDSRILRWTGSQWETLPTDSRTSDSGFPCHTQSQLDNAGVPQNVREGITVCRSSAAADGADSSNANSRYVTQAGLGEQSPWNVSSPACDGRNILIVESVHVPGNDRGGIMTQLGIALNRYHGSQFTYPGQCPSLRAQIDGQDIYPVYYDFGSDRQAMCEAKGRQGGNARTLNTAGDFTDPC